MPKPVTFDGVNIIIAENQEPYIPLPAQVFGDQMGTVLTCWEFTPEEMEEFIRTGKLWLSHWSFNQPFQPLMLSTDRPVFEVEPVPALTLYGHPATFLSACDEKGYTTPGWYFFDALATEVFGPHECQQACEANMQKYAHEKGECGCDADPNGYHCPFPHDRPQA